MSFPDIELALLDWLDDLGYTVTSTPLDLQDQLPVIRVQRIAGEDDSDQDEDHPIISVQVYAQKTAAAPRAGHDLSETIRDRVATINNGGVYVGSQDTLMQHARTVAGPVELPYLDPAISVFQCTYHITTKGR